MTFSTRKDPDSVEDFSIDWIDTLSESSPIDVIATSEWTVEKTLVVDSDAKTNSTTTVWVSGGRLNKYQTIVNKITTTGGRTYNRTITFKVQEK